MILYGAYGSNLNLSQMKVRCPNAVPLLYCYINNWRLVFKGVADIEKAPGYKLTLGLYTITSECEKSLDYYEEFPDVYKKITIKKKINKKIEEILVYIMNNKYNYAKPTQKYFNAIKQGYLSWKLDINFLIKAGEHSIKNHSKYGYESNNWKSNKFINKQFLMKI